MTRRRVLRPGTVYGIRITHPTHDRVVVGYVGKTRRRWRTRIAEHLHGAPGIPPKVWADTVVEPFVLWSDGRVSTFGLWWREVWFIVTRRPLYNIEWNRRNPRRVPPWVAGRHAAERAASRSPGARPPGRFGASRSPGGRAEHRRYPRPATVTADTPTRETVD